MFKKSKFGAGEISTTLKGLFAQDVFLKNYSSLSILIYTTTEKINKERG